MLISIVRIISYSDIYQMKTTKATRWVLILLIANIAFFCVHFMQSDKGIFYFFQLTVIGQMLVVTNFTLSFILHQRKSSVNTKLLMSRLHLITISLEAIIVVGYWGLRIFFAKGILKQGDQRDYWRQLFSFWMHGGSFLTMFYFIQQDQLIMENKRGKKFLFHLCWGLPFILIQYLHWLLTENHVYGFIKYFSWVQLAVFQLFLYTLAVLIDYYFTLRHGYKISLEELESTSHLTIKDLEKKKAEKQKIDEIEEELKRKRKKQI